MTDRDHFAAAALTGLLARVSEKLVSPDAIRDSAYAWADLMLAARDASLRSEDAAYTGGVSASSETKNHDAALAARAWAGVPVAWAAIAKNGQPLWLAYTREDAVGGVFGKDGVIPLYRDPSPPTLTDAERVAIAWAVEVSDSLAECGGAGISPGATNKTSATLRGLLARLGGGA